MQSVKRSLSNLREKVHGNETMLSEMKSIIQQSQRSHFFISHCGSDKQLALALASAIEKDSHNGVWFDRRDIATEEGWPSIREGVRQARSLIIVSTEDAIRSKWVNREIGMAYASMVPVYAFRPHGIVSTFWPGTNPVGSLQTRYRQLAHDHAFSTVSSLDDILESIPADPNEITFPVIERCLSNRRGP